MHWKNPEERTDERAVSPVIGVIMMVAVTVILAAVVSMLVLGMGSDVDSNPQATFSFEYDSAASTVTITHEGGSALEEGQVDVIVAGADDAGAWSSDPITAGDSYTTDGTNNPVTGGETIKIIWTGENGDTATLATYKVPA